MGYVRRSHDTKCLQWPCKNSCSEQQNKRLKQICNHYYSILFTFIIAIERRSSYGVCIFIFSVFFLCSLSLHCLRKARRPNNQRICTISTDASISFIFSAAVVHTFCLSVIKPINHRCCDTPNNVWIHQRQLNKCQTKQNAATNALSIREKLRVYMYIVSVRWAFLFINIGPLPLERNETYKSFNSSNSTFRPRSGRPMIPIGAKIPEIYIIRQ